MTGSATGPRAHRPILDEALLLDDPAAIELVLVRHAQQTFNHLKDPARPRAGDAPLSELGERQAAAAGTVFARERVDAVYCSQLLRAHDTARHIAAHHGLVPIVDERLREVGIYEQIPAGRTVLDEVSESDLELLLDRFEVSRRWDEFPLSESSAAIETRAMAALHDIVTSHPDAARIVVVCHTGIINTVIARVVASAMDALFYPAHASICRLAHRDGRLVVRTLNDYGHVRSAELLTY